MRISPITIVAALGVTASANPTGSLDDQRSNTHALHPPSHLAPGPVHNIAPVEVSKRQDLPGGDEYIPCEEVGLAAGATMCHEQHLLRCNEQNLVEISTDTCTMQKRSVEARRVEKRFWQLLAVRLGSVILRGAIRHELNKDDKPKPNLNNGGTPNMPDQKPEKPAKPDVPAPPPKPEKPEKPDVPAPPPKPEKPEKPDVPAPPPKPEKPEKPAKPEKPDV
jgi:hypothetical protein